MNRARWRALIRHPRVVLLWWVVCGAVLGAVLLEIFRPAPDILDGAELSAAQDARLGLEKRVQVLERERRQLREELAYLKQSVVVEQEACNGVRDALQDKDMVISKLHEQLAFYRGIVSPEESPDGIQVYKLVLDALGERTFQFRVTLLQPVRQAVDAKGVLAMRLEGMVGDRVKSMRLSELMVGGSFSPSYEFRYYTELFGQFRLPEDFAPLRLKVGLIPAGKRRVDWTETYVWNDLMTASKAEESAR